jgi:glyoxylase-like metal-dependent hydrolase (beta-lactamase superfamily II)/predicted ester cyclase
MASSSVIARRYFEALAHRDLEAAVAQWAPDSFDGVNVRFGELFEAFPDLRIELLDTIAQSGRCVVRWRATGTFLGPARLQGFEPNGGRIAIDGCDVLEVRDDVIVGGDFYLDGAAVIQQLRLIPAPGSVAAVANARTWARKALYGAEPEAIAAGVWVLRGGLSRRTNVYLIEDGGGLTVFDAGSAQMTDAIRAAGARLGGIRRVILGHADCGVRGGAARLEAPIYCHPHERLAAEAATPYRDYWDLSLLRSWARPLYPRLLAAWDGGPLDLAGTVDEGDEVAGFRVLHLPGHAPGLIALHRAEDGVALVSDLLYTLNPETGLATDAHVPNPAFNLDTDQARESIRRLAELTPTVVWPAHSRPVSGDDVELQLQRAASAAV